MLRRTLLALTLTLASLLAPVALRAQTAADGDERVVQARDALRKKDRAVLAAARAAASVARHPLAMWVEYWELGNRLGEAQQPELDAFAARWPGSYVEDRLRNDWLLELGRRRDWANFRAEFPRFRMNDDREVTCYALLTQHLEGQDVKAAARAAWLAVREPEDGCNLMARTLYDARVFSADDAWQATRLALENNRPRAARAAAALVAATHGQTVAEIFDNPVRQLTRRRQAAATAGYELELLALMRLAANDPEYAAGQLADAWSQRLPLAYTATAWAHTAKQAALKQLPQAADYARKAWQLWESAHKPGMQPAWSDDLLAWHVRAALRQGGNSVARWSLVLRASEAMSAAEQRDGAWVYWRARAQLAPLAPARGGPESAERESQRAAARSALEGLSTQQGFYAKLAAEDLGGRSALPPAPAPLAAAERDGPRGNPGFTRALRLIAIGLRNEGVREWNYTLRALSERELLAAAQLACEREVWDRCINTSERTRAEIDVAQRFPTPYREQVVARAREAGLDPAVLFGLIRQESRFITDARSGVGASGLMQLMPATARWTAQKIGIDFRPEMVNDPSVNLQLGAAYLKRVLDDFGGSLAMATAAYNAGPGRPRRWREGGATMEPAAWAECIPFNETRDYVKKVLSNSVDYAAVLAAGNPSPSAPITSLKSRLGPAIGPRDAAAPNIDRDLPSATTP